MIATMAPIKPPVCHIERFESTMASVIGTDMLNIPRTSPTWLLVWQLRHALEVALSTVARRNVGTPFSSSRYRIRLPP